MIKYNLFIQVIILIKFSDSVKNKYVVVFRCHCDDIDPQTFKITEVKTNHDNRRFSQPFY